MKPIHDKVRSRNENFAERTTTKIWQERASASNPYIASKVSCYGYDLLELMAKRSFVEVFYLLFRGELPKPEEAELLEHLMIALINPGPRHPATRAAMNAGVGKTDPLHILPIASAVMGGKHQGAGNIELIMRFFRKQQKTDPKIFVKQCCQNIEEAQALGEHVPGFGTQYGGIDIQITAAAEQIAKLDGSGKALSWGMAVSRLLASHGLGWLNTGLAAAVLADLGFLPRAGASIFQLISAPGLLAHGLELANKPITAMPYIKDEDYTIER